MEKWEEFIVYNFTNFSEAALQTIKEHVNKDYAIMDWTLGLAGEAGEVFELLYSEDLSKVELAKELGDVCWYCAALAYELDIDPNDILLMTGHKDAEENLPVRIGQVSEMVKHCIMHKEEFTTGKRFKMKVEISAIMTIISNIATNFNFTLEDVLHLNIAKLSHRYAKSNGKYSHSVSADRHGAEIAFEDTMMYKQLKERIEG